MRRAALWLFLIMIVSYSVAFSAVKGLNISWSDIEGLNIDSNGIVLSEGDRTDINVERSIEVSNVSILKVKGISSDIEIIPETRDDVKIIMKGYHFSDPGYNEPELMTNKNGNTLDIEIKHSKSNNFLNRLSLELTILIPETYEESLEVSTVSGDVNLQFASFEKLSVNTVSGDVTTKNVTVDRSSMGSTSGNIDLRGYSGKLNAQTISGDVDVEYSKITEGATINTTSGSVNVLVPKVESFGINLSSISGDVESDHALVVQKMSEKKIIAGTDNYEHVIDVSTVSGDIDLK